MTQRRGQYVFALLVGLAVATFSYRWITNPEPRAERAAQEAVVLAARSQIVQLIGAEALEIVDPLAPNRKAGKVYVYREDDGWAVSGYYRRNEQDKWHPYLARLNLELQKTHVKVGDPALVARSKTDPTLEASP